MLLVAVHSIIPMRFLNATPVVVVENVFDDLLKSRNKIAEIRDWHINKVSQESKASGLKLTPNYIALYCGDYGSGFGVPPGWLTGPRTWLPGMRNSYFDIPPKATISIRPFANYPNDNGAPLIAGASLSLVCSAMPTFTRNPGTFVPTEARTLGSMFPYKKPARKQTRRIFNCHGCGCGEYNCDSCWCQCDDENCDGPHNEGQYETDEEGEGEEEESEDDVDCNGCGCGSPRCNSCSFELSAVEKDLQEREP